MFKYGKNKKKYKYMTVSKLESLFEQELCNLFIFNDITDQYRVFNQKIKEVKRQAFDLL